MRGRAGIAFALLTCQRSVQAVTADTAEAEKGLRGLLGCLHDGVCSWQLAVSSWGTQFGRSRGFPLLTANCQLPTHTLQMPETMRHSPSTRRNSIRFSSEADWTFSDRPGISYRRV